MCRLLPTGSPRMVSGTGDNQTPTGPRRVRAPCERVCHQVLRMPFAGTAESSINRLRGLAWGGWNVAVVDLQRLR